VEFVRGPLNVLNEFTSAGRQPDTGRAVDVHGAGSETTFLTGFDILNDADRRALVVIFFQSSPPAFITIINAQRRMSQIFESDEIFARFNASFCYKNRVPAKPVFD
jgi:hypothetical protein